VTLSFGALLALFGVAFAAGVVDAIAGGGGLLTLPTLLTAGLPPQLVIGTNKGSAVFGSGAALLRFVRAGLVDWRRVWPLFFVGALGSLGGATLLLALDPTILKPLVLVLLVLAGTVVAFVRPRPSVEALPGRRLKVAALALVVGAYDGFFGPGTGTFLIIGFVTLLPLSLSQASANAKVVNVGSNVAAVALFASRGVIRWDVALPMAVAQFLGGTVGAHLAVRGGDTLVRRVVLVVVLALVLRLAVDLWVSG
jgi:hypothetical protein